MSHLQPGVAEHKGPKQHKESKKQSGKAEQKDKEEQVKAYTVNLSDVLLADFAYIAQTAAQANEDRANATTFYLLAIGSVLATVFAAQSEKFDPVRTALAFTAVFGALSVLGIFTLLQLARLRSAWFSSIYAMNAIKEFALEHSEDKVELNPFPWTNHNMPRRFEPKSVAAFLALQVLLMAALMFGACIFHFGQFWRSGQEWLGLSMIGGFIWGCFGVVVYLWALQPKR